MTEAPSPGDELWNFAVAVYGRDGVPAACLDLQERRGIDVCLLLVALWAGTRRGHRMTLQEVDALKAAAGPWQEEVVQALRRVRRRLKSGPAPAPSPATDALRAEVQGIEIEAERIELAILAAALAPTLPPSPAPERPPGGDAARLNLALACPSREPADEEALDLLAEAASKA